MQVEPMKPMLKAPGTERLKRKYDEVLSSFAFNFNLRHYVEGLYEEDGHRLKRTPMKEAGAYNRPLFGST